MQNSGQMGRMGQKKTKSLSRARVSRETYSSVPSVLTVPLFIGLDELIRQHLEAAVSQLADWHANPCCLNIVASCRQMSFNVMKTMGYAV